MARRSAVGTHPTAALRVAERKALRGLVLVAAGYTAEDRARDRGLRASLGLPPPLPPPPPRRRRPPPPRRAPPRAPRAPRRPRASSPWAARAPPAPPPPRPTTRRRPSSRRRRRRRPRRRRCCCCRRRRRRSSPTPSPLPRRCSRAPEPSVEASWRPWAPCALLSCLPSRAQLRRAQPKTVADCTIDRHDRLDDFFDAV